MSEQAQTDPGRAHGRFRLTREELLAIHEADSDAAGISASGKGLGYDITEYDDGRIVAWTEVSAQHARKGGTVAGGTIFGFFEALGYMVTLAQSPHGTEAFTIDVSIHFLRPGPLGRFMIEGKALRFGKRSSVVAVTVSSPQVPEGPVASGIVTYAPIFPTTE